MAGAVAAGNMMKTMMKMMTAVAEAAAGAGAGTAIRKVVQEKTKKEGKTVAVDGDVHQIMMMMIVAEGIAAPLTMMRTMVAGEEVAVQATMMKMIAGVLAEVAEAQAVVVLQA